MAFRLHRVASRTAGATKQRCYLEIVVRFNRDIPTLVPATRLREQTQLDTYQLVSMLGSFNSCRLVALTDRSLLRGLLTQSLVTDHAREIITEKLYVRLVRYRAQVDHL